jgi:hypothetical protein
VTDGEQVPSHLARDTVALLTPILDGEALAAICALSGCPCDVIAFKQGSLAVMADDQEGMADLAAERVGAVLRDVSLLAMERRDGQLSIVAWKGGVRGEELPPGLALDRAPEAVVALMTGAMTIEQLIEHVPDRVHSGRMGRRQASKVLRRALREGMRRQTEGRDGSE